MNSTVGRGQDSEPAAKRGSQELDGSHINTVMPRTGPRTSKWNSVGNKPHDSSKTLNVKQLDCIQKEELLIFKLSALDFLIFPTYLSYALPSP